MWTRIMIKYPILGGYEWDLPNSEQDPYILMNDEFIIDIFVTICEYESPITQFNVKSNTFSLNS